MRRRAALVLALALAGGGAACSPSTPSIRIGTVYPLTGSQGAGGLDEYRGVRLAADLVNTDGGVGGRRIELDPIDVPGPDAAAQAVDTIASRGIRFVLGSYGSTISRPAVTEAVHRGLLYWETGAVAAMAPAAPPGASPLFFRISPGGSTLGRSAVSFIAQQLVPLLHRTPESIRFAVANVDDAFGNAVAGGAVEEIRSLGLRFAGQFRYDAQHLDPVAVVRDIAATKPDVLFVAAYMEDGIALRRAMVRLHLRLLANIGTSSSYCMPPFGAALGRDAVGLFASDKPDGDALNTSGLTTAGRALLDRARAAFRARYHQEMSAPALAGFSAAWALFHTVMPAAGQMTPQGVAAAALRARIPVGGLPNGSGLELSAPGTIDPGANARAASVIWEWVGVNRRAVVWPPQFATAPIDPISIAS